MIIPIASVLLSLVFLLSTIFLSRRHRLPAWKSSLLAIIFSLSLDIRKDLGGIGGLKQMDDKAKSRNIRLEANQAEWQITNAA